MKTQLLFISGIGIQEVLVICLFVLIFFGSKKIPDFMRGIGKGYREFKDALGDGKKEIDNVKNELPKTN